MELAKIHGVQFSLAANALKTFTYVDDVLTGAFSTAETVRLKQELIDLLKLGSFELHKWCSNEHSVIGDIPEDKRHFEDVDLNKDSLTTKTLCITHEVQSDKFKITAPPNDTGLKSPTKRKILSYISNFFDPMGLTSPVFVKAKNFLQKLWQSNLDWDTPLPA
ncbi:unnamed protein product [Parnassius mnemosyne]|uniref:Reverse transcriptase n=1 Tax=Parnassius mnemosyne TaxID=213953 RepID=A0AAV1KQ62_9NEOP